MQGPRNDAIAARFDLLQVAVAHGPGVPFRNDQRHLDAFALALPPFAQDLAQVAADAAPVAGKIPGVDAKRNHATTAWKSSACCWALRSQLNCSTRSSPAARRRSRRSSSATMRRSAAAHAAASSGGA